MTYFFAKQHGFAYVLCSPKGVIKAIGNDRRTLAYSRQCKRDDLLLTLEQYHEQFPNAR